MKNKAHQFLKDKGCSSMAQMFSAYAVEKMLVEFAEQLLNSDKPQYEHKHVPPFYFLDGEVLVRLIRQEGDKAIICHANMDVPDTDTVDFNRLLIHKKTL